MKNDERHAKDGVAGAKHQGGVETHQSLSINPFRSRPSEASQRLQHYVTLVRKGTTFLRKCVLL